MCTVFGASWHSTLPMLAHPIAPQSNAQTSIDASSLSWGVGTPVVTAR